MLGASQKISNSQSAASEAAGGRPDPEQIRRILSSPEGKRLLQLLRSDGGAGLRAAAAAMQQGNVEGVKTALSPLLSGTEAETLSRKLEEQL